MFGTFAAERDTAIVYGLVDQPQFWNPVKHQVNTWLLQTILHINLHSDILLWKGYRESKVNDQLDRFLLCLCEGSRVVSRN